MRRTRPSGRFAHHFTVDVEEYFQVSALEPYLSREDWETLESRVEPCVDRILELLERHDAFATFFTLGWIAERHPGMLKRIADQGHEVASHGWDHRRVTELEPDEFRESVRRSKSALEELAGIPVRGFRAPSFSIVQGREWALEILIEEGYAYDSSLFPITRRGYGYSSGKRFPYWLELASGRLYEVPPTTLRRFGVNLPSSGGGYFRLLPYSLTRNALLDAERHCEPGTFYIHPWELDPDQPRFDVSPPTRLRQYGGLARTSQRLERLLSEFRFTSIAQSLDSNGRPE
jgi:polysaccharide deacetylase family protein (PEP-CTERM system associated)